MFALCSFIFSKQIHYPNIASTATKRIYPATYFGDDHAIPVSVCFCIYFSQTNNINNNEKWKSGHPN